jgi:hypothetical protein
MASKADPEDDPTLAEFERIVKNEELAEQIRHQKHTDLLARIRTYLQRSKAPKESGGSR